MNARTEPEQHVRDGHCPACGRFLTKTMVRIENTGLTLEQFREYRKGVRIHYGARTKCRNCKVLKDTSAEAV